MYTVKSAEKPAITVHIRVKHNKRHKHISLFVSKIYKEIANAKYIFADDTHSGSLAYGPERILSKGTQIDVWAFKYFGGKALSKNDLLAEYEGYKVLKAFNSNSIYQVDTSTQPYFELTSFHPEILLREFIILAHPKATQFGKLRFYQHLL